MAAVVGPLLLILFGLSGLILLVARNAPGRETDASPRSRDGAAPRARVVWRTGALITRSVRMLGCGLRFIVRGPLLVGRALRRRSPDRRPSGPGTPRVVTPTGTPDPSRYAGAAGAVRVEEGDTTGSEPPMNAEAFRRLRASAILPPSPGRADTGSSVLPPLVLGEPSPPEHDIVQESPVSPEVEHPARAPAERPSHDPVSEPVAESLSLETHVREAVGGRRKVVGRVRTPPASEPRPRPRARPLPSPAHHHVRAEEETPPDARTIARLIEQGEFARAESALTDLLTANPQDTAAYHLLALLYVKRGDFAQVREVCEEGLRRRPGETNLYGPLGRAYYELGQYGKALQVYQRAHDADEENVEYLEQLLRIAARMDRRPLVKVTAEKILALRPEHADAKKSLARVSA